MPDREGGAALEARQLELASAVMLGIGELVQMCDEALEIEGTLVALRSARGQDGPPSLLSIALSELRERLAQMDGSRALEATPEEFEAASLDLLKRHIGRNTTPPAAAGEGGE